MSIFLRAVNFISEWSGKLFSYLWIVAVLVATLEVVRRYVFNAPTLWALELTIFLCAAVYIMGGAYTLYHDKHISVNIIYDRFPPRVRTILDLVTFPFFFVFVSSLAWSGAVLTLRAISLGEGSGSAWNPPIWPMYMIIAVGSALLLLEGLSKLINNIFILLGKRPAQ